MDEFQAIAEEVYSLSTKDIDRIVKQEIETSGISLEIVMDALRKFELEYSNYYNLLKQKRSAVKNKNPNLALIKQQIKEMQMPIYRTFFDFQNKFNLFFEQKIQMVFVYRNDMGEFQLGTSENDLSHVGLSEYGKLEYQMSNIQTFIVNNDYDSKSLDETANSVYDRYRIAKQRIKKKAGIPIFWRINNTVDGRTVNNQGTIAEAYANFYLHQTQLLGSLEARVARYVTDDQEGMASVDNTMGFAVGDVKMGAVQYAVKTNHASLAGMHKVYQIIQKLKSDISLSDDKLLLQLKEQVSQEGKVKQVYDLKKNLENEYQKIVKTLESKKIFDF